MGLREVLTGLTEGLAGGRRYWGRAPQGEARPFVVMNLVSGLRHYHNQGETALVQYRLQLDAYADTMLAASDLIDAAIAALSGYRGGGISGVFFDAPRDLPTSDAGEVNEIVRISVDATIHFTN